jgi:hypothetical protein
MSPKATNSQTPTITTAARPEYQELLPNELATIHGGSVALTYTRISFSYTKQKPDGTL